MKQRVIAGSLGSRTFEAPTGSITHPMSEKIRGAIFNALGDISGLSLLDAFSGSGAIAIEAVSRGASNVVAIDNDRRAFNTIISNTKALKINIKATRANISSWLDNNSDKKFNIVVCDPPYSNINKHYLEKLALAVDFDGLLVISLPPLEQVQFEKFNLVLKKNYNDSKLVIFRRVG